MNRVVFSISTFIAVFCSVVVAGVLLSLSGLYEVNALVGYGIAAILGVDLARRAYRWERVDALDGEVTAART